LSGNSISSVNENSQTFAGLDGGLIQLCVARVLAHGIFCELCLAPCAAAKRGGGDLRVLHVLMPVVAGTWKTIS
jgi:hypothetical protein